MVSCPPEIISQMVFSGIEHITTLIHIGQLDRFSDLERTRVRLILAGYQTKESGFAGPVGAYDPDDPARRYNKGNLFHEDVVSIGFA